MSYIVNASEPLKVSLGETDTVKSVLQNVAVIITTKQGTVPLYREFGIPMRFLDRPFEVAKTILAGEVETYVPMFEPRAKVLNIDFAHDATAHIIPIVEVDIVE